MFLYSAQGFEGTIVVNSFNKDDPSTTLYLNKDATNNGGGVIELQQVDIIFMPIIC